MVFLGLADQSGLQLINQLSQISVRFHFSPTIRDSQRVLLLGMSPKIGLNNREVKLTSATEELVEISQSRLSEILDDDLSCSNPCFESNLVLIRDQRGINDFLDYFAQ